ncbi:hypothetical protein ABZ408_37115 [Streptomyces tibetensis]|uniref:DUF222 domain-containing protein n=1 Tax=Streptomyces tibetensis TaxID=2382123 RepID=A0ABW6NAR2_9ACTN
MTHTEAAAALEEAQLQQHIDRDREDLADDERGPAEIAEWTRIVQLLASIGSTYDPDTDAMVQDELAADAERERAKQLEDDKRRQEEEAETARHAALAPDVLRHGLLRTLARTGLLDSLSEDEQAAVNRLPDSDPAAALALNALLRPPPRSRSRCTSGDRVVTGDPDTTASSSFVAELLDDVKREGLTGAPRHLGFDTADREILSYLPGSGGTTRQQGSSQRAGTSLDGTGRLGRLDRHTALLDQFSGIWAGDLDRCPCPLGAVSLFPRLSRFGRFSRSRNGQPRAAATDGPATAQ